jgi:beta-RFAP synthase
MEGKIIKLSITTPSRLHFGIIDLRGSLGRIHGSAGVAIDKPCIILTAEKSEKIQAEGYRAERAIKNAEQILKYTGIDNGIKFRILSDIPEHQGFGSGTQLALTIGLAIKRLYDLELDLLTIARILGRSKRSGVGTHLFMHGGFILDGGRKITKPDIVPPLLFRSEIPDKWRFVIGIPEIKIKVAGTKENNAFSKLDPPPDEVISKISHIVLLGMLPGILEKDIQVFGNAITKMDSIFGDYWMKIQGGRYGHPLIEKGVHLLLNNGAYGAGQSSWGPAFYGLAEDQSKANILIKELDVFFKKEGVYGGSFVSRPNNFGAKVVIYED